MNGEGRYRTNCHSDVNVLSRLDDGLVYAQSVLSAEYFAVVDQSRSMCTPYLEESVRRKHEAEPEVSIYLLVSQLV